MNDAIFENLNLGTLFSWIWERFWIEIKLFGIGRSFWFWGFGIEIVGLSMPICENVGNILGYTDVCEWYNLEPRSI